MSKIQKIELVMLAAKCSQIEAEIALENNNWDDDAAILEILEK